LALFALGFFTDLEILDVFQSTGLFLHRNKNRENLAFFCPKSWPRNAYEPHIDFHFKPLLFWRGSVTIKVTNFHSPVKTLVSNSCLKPYSILYKSQKREDNEGSVHCADIEGIAVKLGSANLLISRTLGKIPDTSSVPSPRGALFPKQSSKPPQIETWNIIDQCIFSVFRMTSPPHKCKAPRRNAMSPIENFLATVLHLTEPRTSWTSQIPLPRKSGDFWLTPITTSI